ncbi:MAG: GNAT family N-acetyltransferase [Saprospiraceae bacterium]|nr:GNAT family N-acetyltransferase [Saprospiraceae bacterium]
MLHLTVANESHNHEVASMLAALFEEVGHSPDYDAIAAIFNDIDADDRHSTLLAMDDDEAVGVITLVETLSLYAGGYIGVINELYVMPDYRSEGVGKILLDAAKNLAEERGWVRLEVTTPGDEYARTLRFYEREGFMLIGPRYKYLS